MKFANIIVDISLEKLDRTFQYRVPEELQGILKEGMQVRIPFGNGGRTLTGYVLELTDTCEWDEKKLKPILGLAEKGIRLEGQLIALAAWMRRTYGSTMNQALKTVLPVKKSVQEKISRKVRLAVTKEEAEAALANMGTTLVAAVAYENGVVITNVGDSRAYYITEAGITRITKDHSLVETMVDHGDITADEARRHPGRNLITRALGRDTNAACDGYIRPMEQGDFILLCTDGLVNTVTDQEMLFEIVHGGNLDTCLDRLLHISKSQGAPDNVTAVLMQKL